MVARVTVLVGCDSSFVWPVAAGWLAGWSRFAGRLVAVGCPFGLGCLAGLSRLVGRLVPVGWTVGPGWLAG